MPRLSSELKKTFLLEFTKELIRNSSNAPISELEIEFKETKEKEREKIQQAIKKKENIQKKFIPEILQKPLPIGRPSPTVKKFMKKRVLIIPKPRLPQRLQYIRPTITPSKLDLGELNSLIQNPAVESVECNGPDENLIVKGRKGTKEMEYSISETQIKETIKKFAETSKIPVEEGIMHIVYGQWELSAIVAGENEIGSKFIIKKITPSRRFQN